jgi:hypothetical protein
MVRIASALSVGSLSVCLFFACGDKNAKPSPYATSGGTTASAVGGSLTGGTLGAGGSTGAGGTTSGAGGTTTSGSGGAATSAGGTTTGGSGGAAGGNTSTTVSYAATIAPLMKANCATSGCHSGSDQIAGIALDTYANVSTNAGAADTAIQSGSMPPDGPLSAAQQKAFHDWVTAGAPNN